MKKLLTSKRFATAVSGILFVVLNEKLGLDLPMTSVVSIVGLIIAFVVSQGSADKGKEAAKLQIDQENNV